MNCEKIYNAEQIIRLCKESLSYRDFAIKLGYSPNSGNYKITVEKIVKKYNLDISHFTGRAWNKNIINIDDTFKIGCKVKSEKLKRALVLLRGHKCEECKNESWLNQPILLENHHIDGNPLNNSQDNLKLLCPNCHSFTDNFRNKQRATE